MAELATELTTDFSGGMVDSAAPTAFPRTAVAELFNARLLPDGTAERRPGSIRLSTAALNADTGYGGTYFRTAAGEDQLVVIFGANAYMSNDWGVTWSTAIATGLRTDYYSFATMRVGATNYLYAANGDTTVKQWDGTTWTTLSNAPSGVKFLAVFNGRLYATGHSGVLVQASKIADPTTWAAPDGLTVQIIASSGNVPTGLFQIGPHLLVFDRHATSYIDGFGEQTILVATGATGFSRSVGCVGFRTVAAVGDNAVCWLSERGVEYYSPSTGIIALSDSVQRFFAGLDLAELYANPGRMSAAYDEIDQNYYLALSTTGVRNDRIVVMNLLQQAQYQRKGPRGAPSVDTYTTLSADLLFAADADNYLTVDAAGGALDSDASGYATVGAVGAAGGDPVTEDADNYLVSDTADTLPATLFTAPTATRSSVLYSLGYDGFVRRHYGVNTDDQLAAGTGGTAVTMTLLSRPFLFGRVRNRKRARILHVASIQAAAATLTVRVVGNGTGDAQTLTMPITVTDKAYRHRARVKFDDDAPQVKITTTDSTRISLVGLSAEVLRDGLGA